MQGSRNGQSGHWIVECILSSNYTEIMVIIHPFEQYYIFLILAKAKATYIDIKLYDKRIANIGQ